MPTDTPHARPAGATLEELVFASGGEAGGLGAVGSPGVTAVSIRTTRRLDPEGTVARVFNEASVATRFAVGFVVSRGNSSITLRSAQAGQVVVDVSPTTSVWKETEVGLDVIEEGDLLYVRAVPDGSLVVAHRIWVNIGWVHGSIDQPGPNAVTVSVPRLGTRTLYLTPGTLLFDRDNVNLAKEAHLSAGTWVDALGVFLPGGHLRATRIWVG